MKLWKKILIIILIICLLLILCIIRKFTIITSLVNESKEYNYKTNYIAVVESIQNGTISILKSYNKDGDFLTTIKTYGKNIPEERGITRYKKNNEEIGIIQSGQEKIAILDGSVLGDISIVNIFSTLNSTISKLQFALMSKISTDNYNNNDYYLIEMKNWKIWVNKKTGLIEREINEGSVIERYYEFDIVTDEDIIKPDISDCKIQN